MDITIKPGLLSGRIAAIASKSQAHRLLICAAFADTPTNLILHQTNQDIEATADCLRALGTGITRTDSGYLIVPTKQIPPSADLYCKESGSTLRFLLPVVGALGVDAIFHAEGRLPQRPLSPLWEEMERMGCKLSRPSDSTIRCTGRLSPGTFTISGSVSSQFITGLLFAAVLMKGNSRIDITGQLQSKPYIDMTLDALRAFGLDTSLASVTGCRSLHSPDTLIVEGDWSNAAFFLAARCLNNPVEVTGLDPRSSQGDRLITDHLEALSSHAVISAAQTPDLIPILAVVAAAKKGAVFTDIQRLRLKESDRVAAIAGMLNTLGIETRSTDCELQVYPGSFTGGIVDSRNDHRIAMAAAIAATVSAAPVTIRDAQCVAKSYPAFWEDYRKLGGNYEQHIR